MITVEEKLEVFTKLVYNKVRNKCEKELADMHNKSKQEFEAKREEIRKKAEVLIKKSINKGKKEKNDIIMRSKQQSQKNILNYQKKIFTQLLEEITIEAKKIVKTDIYDKYIESSIRKIVISSKEEMTFYIIKDEVGKFENFLKEYEVKYNLKLRNYKIDYTNDDIIGGFIVENKDKTIRIDLTILTLIEDSKAYIGRILYDNLLIKGDNNE